MSDISDTDNLPHRQPLDTVSNNHGKDLQDFLIDSKFCVLNGRYPNDNYTCISNKGLSVVDYMCVPHDVFRCCQSFKVLTVSSIIEEFDIHGLLSERSRLPDHSVLLLKLGIRGDYSFTDVCRKASPSEYSTCKKKYNISKIPRDVMDSERSRIALIELISKIEGSRETQNEVDERYREFCTVVNNELNTRVPSFIGSPSTCKRYKTSKPYWNETLSDLWNEMRIAEQNFLKCKGSRKEREHKRTIFKNARNVFDKYLRQTERAYRLSVAEDIESLSTQKPNDLWDKINSLGPKRKVNSIPIEIVDACGHTVTDENAVFERWKNDFLLSL